MHKNLKKKVNNFVVTYNTYPTMLSEIISLIVLIYRIAIHSLHHHIFLLIHILKQISFYRILTHAIHICILLCKISDFFREEGIFRTYTGWPYKMELVSDFYVSRTGMHRRIKRLRALLIQKEAEDAEKTKYPVHDLNRCSPHDRFGPVNFCHSTGNRGGARRRHFLLFVFCTGIVK